MRPQALSRAASVACADILVTVQSFGPIDVDLQGVMSRAHLAKNIVAMSKTRSRRTFQLALRLRGLRAAAEDRRRAGLLRVVPRGLIDEVHTHSVRRPPDD